MAPPGLPLRAPEEDVFRYAFCVLGDPRDAALVTAAALDLCGPASRRRLIDCVHALCAQLAEAELGPEALAAQAADEARPVDERDDCAVAEHALSRALDGRLPAAEREAV